ncbi:MAG: hypothetical protein EBZ49_18340, partial [Proteobacteria bacterium]|nr:hypothetical protein [Pseudomonadota bacterium]
MRKFIATLFMASLAAFSQECSHLYQYDLKTGTIGPKGYLGDTHAAYGIFAFRNNGSKFYIVKGKFPTARFLSFETTSGSKNGTGKSLFDTQVIPDLGSINPFHDGVALNAQPRNYTLVLAPDNAPRLGPNQITFPKRETLISLYVRYYSPTQAVQVQLSDLPTIEAYDLKSGKPAECGSGWPVENFTNYPQFLGWLSDKPSGVFPFELYQWKKGANSAVGKYAQGHSQMTFDEVALIR